MSSGGPGIRSVGLTPLARSPRPAPAWRNGTPDPLVGAAFRRRPGRRRPVLCTTAFACVDLASGDTGVARRAPTLTSAPDHNLVRLERLDLGIDLSPGVEPCPSASCRSLTAESSG
jgi:hypothetical protein